MEGVASISDRVGDLGGYLREQREHARLSLRQLAQLAGVSNPYLSQVERGLRNPSAEVLQQIARGLQISAEALYVRAGILESEQKRPDVEAAVHADPDLSDRQKRVLLDIYSAFRAENARLAVEPEPWGGGEAEAEPAPRRRAVKRTASSRTGEALAGAKGAKRPRRTAKKSAATASLDAAAGSPAPDTAGVAAEADSAVPAAKVPDRRVPVRRPRATTGGAIPGRRPRRKRDGDTGSEPAGKAQTDSTPADTPQASIEPVEGGSTGTTTTGTTTTATETTTTDD
jgi:transcriptional regulator with XRE-family HTH domain